MPAGPGLGVEINEEVVVERSATGHRWRNPVWRHTDGIYSRVVTCGILCNEHNMMIHSPKYTYKSPVNIKHPKVRWMLIEHLLHQILSQSIKVNEQLPKTNDLCDSLGVSRTAVREAISVLVSKGIVASKPGEGTTVQPLSSWMLFRP